MQGYCSGRLGDVPVIMSLGLTAASPTSTSDVRGAKRLLLNADKTDLLWFGPASQLRQLPSQSSTVHVNQCVVKRATVVRDLGVSWFDAELSMCLQVSRVAQTCFYHNLRRIRVVGRQLGRDVTALVLSRLDYCNAVRAGLLASTLAPFQRVLHAAARTVPEAT